MGSRRSFRVIKGGDDQALFNDDGSKRDERWKSSYKDKSADEDQIQQAEGGLVGGLKPLRDRYLAGALSRMTGPVLLMFPEMEGYTAAVPSKRDMQALIKAIQLELSMAAGEGDALGGLLRAVSREAVKAVQLMVSKVEGMILHTPDTQRILVTLPPAGSTGHSTQSITRTNPQEHNAQLLGLLAQLRDALDKTPSTVMKNHEGNNGDEEEVTIMLLHALKGAVVCVDLVITKQLLSPLVDAITAHLKVILIPLLKEGISTQQTRGDDSSQDCSRPVQAIVKLIPEIIRVHLHSLASCPPVGYAVEEMGLRVLHLYVTVAALVRPVSEQARLRTARDMGALEAALTAAGMNIGGRDSNPVIQEFRSFRRLLFMDDVDQSGSPRTNDKNNEPTTRAKLLLLPFIRDLRPSSLLGYLTSCGPSQLPSAHLSLSSDVDGALLLYVDSLTVLRSTEGSSQSVVFPSVAALYVCKIPGSDTQEGEGDWRGMAGETKAWEALQSSLDVFVQRISVAEPGKKAGMRAWYESLQDIGGLYYGNTFSMQ